MIIGIGNDIIEVSRIEQAIARYGQTFLDRHFTPEEQNYCNKYRLASRNYAGRFAAKEAIVKALGTGIGKKIGWLDIEIINNEDGKPSVSFSGQAKKSFAGIRVHVTLSHCKEYATAFAIAEVDKDKSNGKSQTAQGR